MPDTPHRVLRTKLQRGAGLLMPGAANALAARVIEQLGFDAILVTGAGIANTFLGVPDIGLLSVTELTDARSTASRSRTVPSFSLSAASSRSEGRALTPRREARPRRSDAARRLR